MVKCSSYINSALSLKSCADPKRFGRGGPTLTTFLFLLFLLDEKGEDSNTTKIGSSLARQRNANEIGSFVVFREIRTSIAKKPYIFVIFEGVRTPCPPSGSARVKSQFVARMQLFQLSEEKPHMFGCFISI